MQAKDTWQGEGLDKKLTRDILPYQPNPTTVILKPLTSA